MPYAIVTENINGNLHEAAGYINSRSLLYAETLMALTTVTGGGACIAVYKVPTKYVRWMWGDLRYDMSSCPVE